MLSLENERRPLDENTRLVFIIVPTTGNMAQGHFNMGHCFLDDEATFTLISNREKADPTQKFRSNI